jgi:O-antigen/teichoic acid export membrane protein
MGIALETLDHDDDSVRGRRLHIARTRESLSRNVSFDIAARIGYLVSRVLIPPFVLSRVGLSAYSLWSAVFLLLSYMGMTTFGFSWVYVKYVAEYVVRDETRKANELLSTGLVTIAPICVAMFVLLWLGLPRVILWLRIPVELQHSARQVILLVAAAFLCDITMSVYGQALTGIQKIAEVQIIWVISYLTETALILALVGTGHGVLGLAEAYAVRTALSIVLAAIAAYHYVPWLRLSIRSFSRQALRPLINYGGVVQLNMILNVGLNTIERVIAAPLIGLTAVGILDLSDKLPTMANTIPGAFASSLMPAASNIHSELAGKPHQAELLAKLYLKGARYMNLVAASLAGLFATASGPLLIVWLGKVYPGTAFLMAIFAIQQHIHLMTGPGTSILKGIGRPQEEFFYSVPNVLLVIAAMPLSRLVLGHWSAVGLGSAVVIATIASAIGFIVRANRLLHISWYKYWQYVVAPGLIPYAFGMIFAFPAWKYAQYATRGQLALIMLVIGSLYSFTVLVVFDRAVLDRDERLFFRDAVRRECSRLPYVGRRAEAL